MNKELIYTAYHEEIRDHEGNLIIPASLFKFYKENGKDCFGYDYIATCEQVYARKNKNMNKKVIGVDDFRGAKGIKEEFYDMEGMKNYLNMLIQDGYKLKRMTAHMTCPMADELFQHVMEECRKNQVFKLPS